MGKGEGGRGGDRVSQELSFRMSIQAHLQAYMAQYRYFRTASKQHNEQRAAVLAKKTSLDKREGRYSECVWSICSYLY